MAVALVRSGIVDRINVRVAVKLGGYSDELTELLVSAIVLLFVYTFLTERPFVVTLLELRLAKITVNALQFYAPIRQVKYTKTKTKELGCPLTQENCFSDVSSINLEATLIDIVIF